VSEEWLALRIVAVAVLAEVLLNESALTRCSDMFAERPRSSSAGDFTHVWERRHRRGGKARSMRPAGRSAPLGAQDAMP
jgi:hypothetical protein